jgi:hypothetical protein
MIKQKVETVTPSLVRRLTPETALYEFTTSKAYLDMTSELKSLRGRVEALESRYLERKPSIQKMEEFNGDVAPVPDNNLKMKHEDKIASMRNCMRILPPNLIIHGRHTKENVQAICGFLVDVDMMDEAYDGFKHD